MAIHDLAVLDGVVSAMIDRVTIKGYKSLLDEQVELGTLNVFIGANGAGKSAVLEAIGVLGAAAEGAVDDASLLRRGVRPGVPALYKSAFRTGKIPTSIRLTARLQSSPCATYTVALDNPVSEDSAGSWRFTHESVEVDGTKLVSRSPNGATFRGSAGRERRFEPSDQRRSVARTPSPLGPFPSAAIQLLDLLRDYAIFDPQTPILRGTQPDFIQRDPVGLNGGRLAEAIQALLRDGESRGEIGRLALDELHEMLGWTSGVTTAPPTPDLISPSIPVASEIVRFTDRFMREGRNSLSAYDASEGALYVLFALVLLFHPRTPKFFAVENVDHALHPRLARKVIEIIARFAGTMGRQVLLTTHNPLVLDALPLQDPSVRLLAVDRTSTGSTKIRQIDYAAVAKAATAHGRTLSQLWVNGLLGAVPNLA